MPYHVIVESVELVRAVKRDRGDVIFALVFYQFSATGLRHFRSPVVAGVVTSALSKTFAVVGEYTMDLVLANLIVQRDHRESYFRHVVTGAAQSGPEDLVDLANRIGRGYPHVHQKIGLYHAHHRDHQRFGGDAGFDAPEDVLADTLLDELPEGVAKGLLPLSGRAKTGGESADVKDI